MFGIDMSSKQHTYKILKNRLRIVKPLKLRYGKSASKMAKTYTEKLEHGTDDVQPYASTLAASLNLLSYR